MERKLLGNTLLVVGVVVAVASLLADSIGIGDSPGIGREQIAAVIAGIVAAVAGMYLRRMAAEEEDVQS